ncbi:MAG: retropepsin-like aspartic protease [bacterium]
MRFSTLACITIAALACVPATRLRADTVHLKNGRTMDGIITKETDAAIVLNIGVGVVTLKKSQIASIVKSGVAARAKIEEDWKKHYFAHGKYAPKGFEDLAASFNGLEKQRQAAMAAAKNASRLKAGVAQAEADLKAMAKEYVNVSHQLLALPPLDKDSAKNVDAYNEVVGRKNSLASAVTIREDAVQRTGEQIETETRRIADYLQALERFRNAYAERIVKTSISTNDATFFAEIDARLKGYGTEIRRFDIAYEDEGHSMIVKVRLNDTATGRFVVDTGASVVSLSRAMASRLNLEVASDRAIRVTVADGRSVSAYPVILKSVQTGDARALNIAAVILDKEPSPGVDGLLGLTFLREFDFHYDAKGHRLELTGFQPGNR